MTSVRLASASASLSVAWLREFGGRRLHHHQDGLVALGKAVSNAVSRWRQSRSGAISWLMSVVIAKFRAV